MDTPIPARDWRIPLLLITGAVATAVSLFLMYGPVSGIAGKKNDMLAVAIGPTEVSRAHVLGKDGTLTTLDSVREDGSTAQVIDRVAGMHGTTYSILADKDSFTTNIYAQTAEGAVTQLTHSSTLKYGLSYSAATDSLLYRTAMITKSDELVSPSWEVKVLSLASNEESTIGTAKDAVLSADGTRALVATKSTIASLPVSNPSGKKDLLEIPEDTVLALSADGMIAFWNYTTRAVDVFSSPNSGVAVSYIGSVPLEQKPSAMGFAQGTLVIATPVSNEVGTKIQLTSMQSGPIKYVLLKDVVPSIQIKRIFAI